MDADRPNLQLALGSGKEEKRKETSELEAGYRCIIETRWTQDSLEMESPGLVPFVLGIWPKSWVRRRGVRMEPIQHPGFSPCSLSSQKLK